MNVQPNLLRKDLKSFFVKKYFTNGEGTQAKRLCKIISQDHEPYHANSGRYEKSSHFKTNHLKSFIEKLTNM